MNNDMITDIVRVLQGSAERQTKRDGKKSESYWIAPEDVRDLGQLYGQRPALTALIRAGYERNPLNNGSWHQPKDKVGWGQLEMPWAALAALRAEWRCEKVLGRA